MNPAILPSDVAFTMFLATIIPSDLNEYEYRIFQFHKLTKEQV